MDVQKEKGKKEASNGTSEKQFKRSRSAWLKDLSQRHVVLWSFSFVFKVVVFFFVILSLMPVAAGRHCRDVTLHLSALHCPQEVRHPQHKLPTLLASDTRDSDYYRPWELN